MAKILLPFFSLLYYATIILYIHDLLIVALFIDYMLDHIFTSSHCHIVTSSLCQELFFWCHFLFLNSTLSRICFSTDTNMEKLFTVYQQTLWWDYSTGFNWHWYGLTIQRVCYGIELVIITNNCNQHTYFIILSLFNFFLYFITILHTPFYHWVLTLFFPFFFMS